MTVSGVGHVPQVGEGGRVTGIEHIPELVAASLRNTQKSQGHLLAAGRLQLVQGDGRLGHAAGGPYDAIHVGAAAPTLPRALVEQLSPGGRLVIPVGEHQQELMLYDKQADGRVMERSAMSVIYVPLTSKEFQLSRA
eukprot:scaffold131_cov632-Prasinococcus_capsulatus_cf.AAC.3